ncbi:Prenylcysteine oxidase [Aspergillus heteromorphus CBS 117.55]|uniref:Prenylcysteine oxidase n=1 Tax=Aspergillus heteromorphus CBS 117.55 TaxID=1448321 RepID=A0A317X6X8_9EURO|nr:Prenylcysteine oxidase [Aspergillus heteromorphus CBS 117.55]PWY92628.1 Prenylcysteine oxidase [Aspergillus heteromorphus CBS 117.55]
MDSSSRYRFFRFSLYAHVLCYVITLCLIPLGHAASASSEVTPAKRVAVIGAGAAGSTTAYSLRKYADALQIPVNITVFERSSYVGGRSTTVNVLDNPANPVELGASIFVDINQHLVNASKELGLHVTSANYLRPRETEDTIGVWDGEQFAFVMKDSSSWWNIAKLIWKYGLAPIRTYRLMKFTVNKFLDLYDEPIFPFESLTLATEAAGLLNTTAVSGAFFLQKNSISSEFSREVIQASTRVNYGQNLPLIHGLETMVCMATDGAMSVEGGNWLIFDGMLNLSHADVRLNHTVTSIDWAPNGPSTLTFQTNTNNPSPEQLDFDEVVIAGPWQFADITITPPPKKTPDEIPFVKLHVTLFSSPHRISPKYFGLTDPDAHTPETILTTLPPGTDLGKSEAGVGPAGFWSISTLRTVPAPDPAEGKHYVYKIFSPERPTAKFMKSILGLETSASDSTTSIGDLPKRDVSWFHEKIWRPYPFVYPRVTFEDPLLAPHIWYTGGIESFISTMETSALMGRNVAALMSREWQAQKENENEEKAREGSSSSADDEMRVEL